MNRQRRTGTIAPLLLAALFVATVPLAAPSGALHSGGPGDASSGLRTLLSLPSSASKQSGTSDPLTTSTTVSVAAGGSIYVGALAIASEQNVPQVTDSAGNPYVLVSAYNDSSSTQTYSIFYHDYSTASSVTVSADFPKSGYHYALVAFAVNGTASPSLDAVGAWSNATSSTQISASVEAPNDGDLVAIFPFSSAGGGSPNYYGFTTATPGFANVSGGWESTDSAGWVGNIAYAVEPGSGTYSMTAGGDPANGDTAGVAVAIRSSTSTFAVSDLHVTAYTSTSFNESWTQPANVTNDTLWLIPGACPQTLAGPVSAGAVTSQAYASLTQFLYCAAVEPWNGTVAGEPVTLTVQLVDLLGQVVGDANGYGSAPPIAGTTITAYPVTSCHSPIGPSTCSEAGSTVSGGAGQFGLNLSSGESYYLAATPNTALTSGNAPYGWGGGGLVRVRPPVTSVVMTVYPYVPYGNATIVLPGYQCEAAYVYGPGCENPVLSWTQSGAYYLTAFEGVTQLSFYSFVNQSVYNLSAFAPLYQRFPSYPMIPSELFATQDGAYVYSWGTLSPSATNLTVEAVNVTTHRWFEYNFTGFTTAAARVNGQLQLTGWDGNDSQVTLILANGSIYDHNLWSDSQRLVTTLPYFEANNIYWEPFLNGYINCQAGGSTSDGIDEWQLSGPSSTALSRTYQGRWSTSPIAVNGVNGAFFNLTSREVEVSVEWTELDLKVNGAGTVTGITQEGTSYPAASGDHFVPETAMESDRPGLVVDGAPYGSDYAGFDNDSWLQSTDPGHFGYLATNVSPFPWNGANQSFPYNDLYSWQSFGQEGFFYNSSYLLAPTSYQCGGLLSRSCPINGGGGHPVGTVWWMWQMGLPEFPEPALSPAADTTVPGPVTVTSASATSSSITLEWNASDVGGTVNYTVAYGPSPDYGVDLPLPPYATTCTLTGLADRTTYYFSVEPWNLHYHGESIGITNATTGVPSPPSALTVTAYTATSVSLNWTNPGDAGLVNDTVYYGTSSGAWTAAQSLGSAATSTTISGLSSGTRYFFTVTAWNATGQSGPSNVVAQWTASPTGAPSGLTVTSVAMTSVTLGWTNPPSGALTNNTVYWGPSVGAWSDSLSTEGVAGSATVSGLESGQLYVFAVAVWSGALESSLSSPVFQRTASVPAAPSELAATAESSTAVSLSWTNPTGGGLLNDTVYWGTSSGPWTHAMTTGGVAEAALVVGLLTFTTYYFAVAAWNSTGESPTSSTVATVVEHAPPAPAKLVVASLSTFAATLDWKQAVGGGIVNDTLYLFAGGSCAGGYVRLESGIATAGTFDDLPAATRFSALVTAWNSTGQSPGSACVAFTTGNPAPSAPGGVRVTAVANTSVTLAWTNPLGGGIVNDTVYWGTAPGQWTVARSLGTAETTATIAALAPGQLYFFAVAAWNDSGESPLSVTVSQRTAEAPGAVTGLVVVGSTSTTVTLRWTDPPGGGLTNLTMDYGAANGTIDRSYSCGNVTVCTVSGLEPGTFYLFDVVAWNATGAGIPSAVVRAETTVPSAAAASGSRPLDFPELTLIVGAGVFVGLALARAAHGRRR